MKKITVLGATGSIGVSTLDVIQRNASDYSVFALTAATSIELLEQQILTHRPPFAVVVDEQAAASLRERLCSHGGVSTEVLSGAAALEQVASAAEVDYVMAAIVGAAGLLPTLAAARAGKRVLLANKEALVMSGELLIEAVDDHHAELLPIDSEHNAIFQCLPVDTGLHTADFSGAGVARIILTGSGGPFRTLPLAQLSAVTPDQACAHPNWEMGRKISVDSATMMNKGLELIEACYLFNTTAEQIDVVIHPQSVVHSMVQYVDGSVIAQLGNPDMRTPIAHALAWPQRIESGVGFLDIVSVAQLDFAAPDYQRFPCLRLAQQAVDEGGTAPTVLNAANETAVDAFLQKKIRFTDISQTIAYTQEKLPVQAADSLETILEADRQAREVAAGYISGINTGKGTQ